MGPKGKSTRPTEPSGPQQLAREVTQELKRVVWPTPRQVLGYTGFVVLAVIVVSLLTVVLDLIFRFGIGKIVP
ncbi:MAG: preprotein translocase subunit SecE [Clostridia bacterium]